MKFYIIQQNLYEFEGYIYIKSSKNDFINYLKNIENKSLVVTDLFNNNTDLLWFNKINIIF